MPRRYRKTMRKKHTNKYDIPLTNNPKKREFRFKAFNQGKVKPEPFPQKLLTRSKYFLSEILETEMGSSLANAITFRANSIWEPCVTVTDKTTVGWANMSALYNRYLVTGCKIIVNFDNPDKDGQIVGVKLLTNGATSVHNQTWENIAQQPMVYSRKISNSGSQSRSISLFVRPWDLMSMSKLEYFASTANFGAAMAYNPPADNAKFEVFMVQPSPEAGVAENIRVNVKIIYYVSYYERKPLISTNHV